MYFYTKDHRLNPKELLAKYWGYTEFRPPQEEIIASVLNRKDTLAILPTGGGKSLCYQIPALIFEGMTLVVSPLIALMQDQVQALNQLGIPAANISSQLSQEEINEVINRCLSGEIKLLYIAPERLSNREFLFLLNEVKISLIAIDEAHCIAQWGHDFRPAYLKINQIKEILPHTPILALTATATPKIREEIVDALHLKGVQIFKTSLKRNNLTYRILSTQNELDDLVYELKKKPGSAIVFCRTRSQTYKIAQFLTDKGFNADYFHARLPNEEKKIKQEYWTNSPDQIMVATNAFGMGIDKADVRLVIHLDLPSSLEAYVQEAGRAGRDGEASEAILFLKPYAIEESENIFKSGLPTKKEYERIESLFYSHFQIGENERPDKKEFIWNQFVKKFSLDKRKTEKVLSFLERKEVILIEQKSNLSFVQLYTNPKNLPLNRSLNFQVLEILSRKYPGILGREMAINEYAIARELRKPVILIQKALNELNQSGYLHYQNNEVQNVYFLRPRESDYIKNTLWREFELVQQNQWKRLQDLIYYVSQTENCRERLIVRYFGELGKTRCGHCDICHQDQTDFNPRLILDYLDDSPQKIHQILEHFIQYPKEEVLEAMTFLSDEELIEALDLDTFVKKKN